MNPYKVINKYRYPVYILLITALSLSVFSAVNLFRKLNTQPQYIIQDKININTASASSLMRIPDIGYSLSNMIVNYTENYTITSPNDLTKIKGIGPKKAEIISKYVTFE